MSETALAVEAREATGKGVARKLRAAGRIPGVLYGPKLGSVALALDPKPLERILRKSGANTLFDLEITGRDDLGTTVALLKDMPRDPVRGRPLHADFYQVDLGKTVEVSVSVHLTGKSHGVELGGVLDHLIREITVECLPRAIPESFEVDISGLGIGDVLHVRDVALPEGVTLVTDGDLGLCHVVTPTVEEAPAAEAAAVEEAAAAAEAAPEAETPPTEGGGESS